MIIDSYVYRSLMSNNARLTFDPRDHRLQTALRERINAYFTERGISRHADGRMVAKTVVFLGGSAALWALLASGVTGAWLGLPLAVLLGVMLAGVGFNVCHDAIHGSYSSRPWVNRLLSHTFDLMGASSYTWARAHNFVHHTYTNVPGMDHDLEPGPFLLLYPRDNPGFVYRFQHLYALVLYCFTTLVWVFKKDFEQVFSIDPRTGKREPVGQVVQVIGWKLVHLALFLGVPLWVGAFAWWQVAIGYLAMQAALGLTSAVVFQLAHVVESTAFPQPGAVNHSWAEHQLRTTSNFAPRNRLASFFFGGLNRQVEHHLLAKICHVHYPQLAPIVRAVAFEHGLPYHENPTFLHALGSHLRTLQRFGHPTTVSQLRLATEQM
ncbi:MAG: acyl-CoA desaturase [Myxococcaceae bacterium]|nr:acyl-CoA desaturase [Myxococcaceae bacterium]